MSHSGCSTPRALWPCNLTHYGPTIEHSRYIQPSVQKFDLARMFASADEDYGSLLVRYSSLFSLRALVRLLSKRAGSSIKESSGHFRIPGETPSRGALPLCYPSFLCGTRVIYTSIKRTKTSLNFVGISTCTRLVQFFNVNRVPDGQPDSLASACKPVVCTRDSRVSLY